MINLKRSAAVFFTFALLLFFSAPVDAATLGLSPATQTLNRGCTYPIAINLNTEGKNTDGTDVILTYESSKLTTTTSDITNGTVYPDYPGNSVDPASNQIAIVGLASVTQPFNGSGIFATIKFTVSPTAAAGPTTIKFAFNPQDKTNSSDSNVVEKDTIADLLNQVTDGNYTIGTATSCTGGTGAVTTIPVSSGSGAVISSPSATQAPPALQNAGFFDQTVAFTIIGVTLTIIGIAGLALL